MGLLLIPSDMRLLPREEKFYGLFLKQADIISEAARLLLDGVRAGNSTLAAFAMEINVLEHRGDELIHEIFTRLNQTFITPLDPEDIHNISSSLDNVLDGLEDTSHRLLSYHIDPIPPSMITLAEIVRNCAKAMHSAFEALEAGRPLMEHCIEINRLENEGDLIGRGAVADLFNKEKDPILLIKLKEVYDFFEETIDSCEDVADVLQNVVVKNS
jgi:predicted phosphate transport protein (TIGR00153 family)